jgi:hypothetical protein
LVVKKKLGGYRFLADFSKLNGRCNKIVYPLPRIEDSIQRLADPKYFSSMDRVKGFWQKPIHAEDKKFFAFGAENMHLEYQVAPRGSKNSPAHPGSLMQLVLRGLPPQHVISDLDDILCADSMMEKHHPHEEGDWVYEAVPRKYRNKIQPKWDGPLKIVRRRSSPDGDQGTTYVCRRRDGSLCERNYEQTKKVRAPIATPEVVNPNITAILPIVMLVPLSCPSSPVSAQTRSRHQSVPLDATEPQSPELHPQSPAMAENLQEIQSLSSPEIAVEDGAYPTSATAGKAQDNQAPPSPEIAVEDGAYPTSATAGKAQENQASSSPEIAEEDGAYPTSATAGKTQENLVHLPP